MPRREEETWVVAQFLSHYRNLRARLSDLLGVLSNAIALQTEIEKADASSFAGECGKFCVAVPDIGSIPFDSKVDDKNLLRRSVADLHSVR